MPTRASVGERFFQSMTVSAILKRLKKKLALAAEFHLKHHPQADPDSKVDSPPPTARHPGSPSREFRFSLSALKK